MLTLHETVQLLKDTGIPEVRLEIPDAAQGYSRYVGVSTDSRTLVKGDLFIALDGERFDGHEYIGAIAERGAVAAMVSRTVAVPIPQIIVPDTTRALGLLALGWRRKFDIPVVAVTGSNGKTTVKEMVSAILAAAFGDYGRLATEGNLNNEIGLPLTLLRLRTHHRAAVVELGMNHPHETMWLAALASPTVALVNNAQREHQEFMETVEAVAYEHALAIRALPDKGIAVFPAADEQAAVWWTVTEHRKVIDFAHVSYTGITRPVVRYNLITDANSTDQFENRVELFLPAGRIEVVLHAAGLHNAHNAAGAAAAAVAIGIKPDTIRRGLEFFRPVRGRMERKQATAGALLIDDTYNANPDSVRAAIDVLAASPAPRTLVLGDMGEVGEHGPSFHTEIGTYARERGIENLLALGTLTQYSVNAYGKAGQHYKSIEDIVAHAASKATSGTVLVKGSRFMRMERVVAALAGTTASQPQGN